MATELRLRRGTTDEHGNFIGAEAEATVDTDKNTIVVHDGQTQGGYPLATEDTTSKTFDSVSDMESDAGLVVGQKVRTLGYYSPGDGGANDYEIVVFGTGTDDGGSFIDLSGSGLQAKGLFVDGKKYVAQFGAVGDGVTDDTNAFMSARGSESSPSVVYVGTPATSYLVSNFQMGAGCVLQGEGKEVSKIKGNGVDPVVLFGDGVDSSLRDNHMFDVRVENDGAPCVVGRTSQNWKINRCYIKSTSGDGSFNSVDFDLSYRGDFSHNEGGISGAGWGLALRNNANGQIVHHNQWSGGQGGSAFTAGSCQGISFKWNIIESSLDGIYVSSLSGTGEGNCNGVEIDNNYFEQVRNPIVLGSVFNVRGWSVNNNWVGNENQSIIAARDAVFKIGRAQSGSLQGNSVSVASDGSENLFDVVLDTINDFFDNEIQKGYVLNTPNNLLIFSGTYSDNTSVLRFTGGNNYFDFKGITSCRDYKEYISPLFQANVSNSVGWLHPSSLEIGGEIISAEVVEKNGSLAGASLRIGDSGNTGRIAVVDLDAVTFTDDYYRVTLASNPVFTGTLNNLVENNPGTGTGTYRVKLRYRAT